MLLPQQDNDESGEVRLIAFDRGQYLMELSLVDVSFVDGFGGVRGTSFLVAFFDLFVEVEHVCEVLQIQ